ncbi:MAG TPA: ATP-binding cassette domain-containing protein, partial [Gaiella sp.]
MSAAVDTALALDVEDLRLAYRVRGIDRPVLRGVSLTIERGRSYGLVGESGCGKSTTGRLILRLLDPTSGSIWFDGNDLAALGAGDLREVRQRLQIVFQDPYASLNPRKTVESAIGESLKVHRDMSSKDAG